MKKQFAQLSLMIAMLMISINISAQYKEFSLTENGDTMNIIDKKGLKQGKWLISIPEIRGEPGYEEEGVFKNNEKVGLWRKYTLNNEIIAVENYKAGSKDGLQQYYTFLGVLEREEEWMGYDPADPYDTVAVYGEGNNEVIDYKIVKVEPYSVKHGKWKYYDPQTGRLIRIEEYDRGALVDKNKKTETQPAAKTEKKAPEKTAEMLDYEKKTSKKKQAKNQRDGQTSL